MPDKVFCVQCGASIPADSEFCHVCGTKQPVEKAPLDKNVCPKCGTVLEADSEFCHICGTKITVNKAMPQKVFCVKCGAEVTDDSDFCFKCGAKIERNDPENDSETVSATKETVPESITPSDPEALLKRAFLFLEDEDWHNATQYFEKVLDIDPESAEAYLGKFMAKNNIRTRLDITNVCTKLVKDKSLFDDKDYAKANRFGDEQFKAKLEEYNNKTIYLFAEQCEIKAQYAEDYLNAAKAFERIKGYSDSDERAQKNKEKGIESTYKMAVEKMNDGSLDALRFAVELFGNLDGYSDSQERVNECKEKIAKLESEKEASDLKEQKYQKAVSLMEDGYSGALENAARQFRALGDYKDSKEKEKQCVSRLFGNEAGAPTTSPQQNANSYIHPLLVPDGSTQNYGSQAQQAPPNQPKKFNHLKWIIPTVSAAVIAVVLIIVIPKSKPDAAGEDIPTDTFSEENDPQETSEAAAGVFRYARSELPAMNKPGKSGSADFRIPCGAQVEVFPDKTKNADGFSWSYVDYNGSRGWVNTDFLTETKPTDEPAQERTEYRYTTKGVKLWSTASYSGNVLKEIPRRTQLLVYPDQTVYADGRNMIKVSYYNTIGWVESDSLSLSDPGEERFGLDDFVGYFGTWNYGEFQSIEITGNAYSIYIKISTTYLRCKGDLYPGDLVGDTLHFYVDGTEHTLKVKLPDLGSSEKSLCLDGSTWFGTSWM